jgi:hypothetical protein
MNKSFAVVDNIKAVKGFCYPQAALKAWGNPFNWNGLKYVPKYNQWGDVTRYESNLRNLKILMYCDRIILINSIHKFFLGNNYSDFNLSKMESSIHAICCHTGINWWDADVKRIEYGCNVNTSSSQVVKNLLAHKGKDFMPMLHKGQQYGSKCEFDQYQIKAYDKCFEVLKHENIKLDEKLLRFEIPVINMKYLHQRKEQVPLFKMRDLIKPECIQHLANDIIEKFRNISKKPLVPLEELSVSQQKVLAVMLLPDIKENIKKNHKDTFKRDQRIFREISQKCKEESYTEIETLLKEKCIELING